MAVALEELVGPAGADPYGDRRARPRLRVVGPEERRVRPDGGRPSIRRRRAVYVRRRIAVAVAVTGVVTAAAIAVTPLLSMDPAPAVFQGVAGTGAPDGETAVAGAEGVPPVVPATVVIAEGQTVWDRVGAYTPAGMTRHDWVAQVLAVNDVDPLAVAPGTTLRLPTRR